MPEIPVFVNHGGQPTDEGRVILAYIEAQVESAGRSTAKLNALPGAVKHFIAMTKTTMTPAQWLDENRLGYANLVYDMAVALRESQQQKQQTNDIAAQLAQLNESLAQMLKTNEAQAQRIKALEDAQQTATEEQPAAAETPEEAEDEDEDEAEATDAETTDEA